MTDKKFRVADAVSDFIIRRTGAVMLILVVLTAASAWRVSKLTINHDQLELLPPELDSVKATKEMVKLVGSVGFLLIPMKSNDLEHLKKVIEDVGPQIRELPEVRKITYKQDTEFFLKRIGMYIETEDLKEGSKRIRKKIRSILNKNNPFAISLTDKKEDYELDLSDLVDKYSRLNKKAVDDPYYVDKKREAILMVIAPTGEATDLEFVRSLLGKIEKVFADYNAQNPHGANLAEHYEGLAPGATVTYGYTGGFKRSLDDSETMKAALIPTSGFAFIGILLYLIWTLRRPTQIAILMATLVIVIILTFAFCEIVLGELNSITSILGAILMGLGIDFGIHHMYRLREEYTLQGDLPGAVRETLRHSGAASFGSAITTAAALLVLMLSDFKGFSHFGLVAGTGVLLSFVLMYVAIPTIYLMGSKKFPKLAEGLRNAKMSQEREALASKPFPKAKAILLGSGALTLLMALAASQIKFDYDSRSLMTVDRPSMVLQDEITRRWDMSSDPVGYYTETMEEAAKLYAHFVPIPEDSNIDQVFSLPGLVPPEEKQKANKKILAKLHRQISELDPSMIEDVQIRKNYDLGLELLGVDPFTLDDVPQHITKQFRPVPASGRDGYLTFIYPRTSLWDGEELVAFAKEVGKTELDGKNYYAAGLTILFADLAQIVLRDGIMFTLLTALAIFLIAWFDFRSIKGAIIAVLPLVAGLFWMLGMMAIASWRINFMNIVVFPLVFGYGISAGIHLYHRFLEANSVMVAFKRTGMAIAASSITTLIGWAALLLSDHRGLESMGILACFGIASTLLVSLTVMPALLQVLHGGGETKESKPSTDEPVGSAQ